MTPQQLIDRALRAVGRGCIYKLGKGGMRGDAKWPWTSLMECDCSGFAAWCLAVSRKTNHPWYKEQNGGWLETTAIARDCTTPFGMFDPVPWEHGKPGQFLVWGDSRLGQGHIGIVTQADASGPTRVVHCSSGNYRKTGDAIRETDVAIFKRNGALVARCSLVVPPPPEVPGHTFTLEP